MSIEEDVFVNTPLAAEDAIFALTAMFKADPSKDKVSCGVGAYRDNQGLPYVLPVVRKVHLSISLSLSSSRSNEPVTKACVEVIRILNRLLSYAVGD
jgi:aspartate aminotransferase